MSAAAARAAIDGYERRRLRIGGSILDAADALVREHGGVGFSMRELAARAEVSPATPFNHFGSKSGVLAALVGRGLEGLRDAARSQPADLDPIDRIFAFVDHLTAFYAADPDLYRPVLGALFGRGVAEDAPVTGSAIRSWRRGLVAARRAGMFEAGVDVDALALQLETSWLGSVLPWLSGRIDAPSWRGRVEYGVALILAGVTTEPKRVLLRQRALRVQRS